MVFDPSIYKLADGINEKDEVPRRFAGVREQEDRNRHAYKKPSTSELCVKEEPKLGRLKANAGLSGPANSLRFHEETMSNQ